MRKAASAASAGALRRPPVCDAQAIGDLGNGGRAVARQKFDRDASGLERRNHVLGILAQTFEDWELIVVDDGSTDRTPDVVAGYGDARIRYHRQENAGRAAARSAPDDMP